MSLTSWGLKKQKICKNSDDDDDFEYPFNELMLWAILTQRQEMAYFLWLYGEEAMAKALAAVRLYKCFSKEIANEFLELEVSRQLGECAE